MTTIHLPARCDRAAADVLLPQLRDAVACGDLTIDGRSVVQLGQATLQMLIAVHNAAAAFGNRLVVQPSEAMAATLAMAGAETLADGVRA